MIAAAAAIALAVVAATAQDELTLVSGERVNGKLVAIDAGGKVTFATGDAKREVALELCERIALVKRAHHREPGEPGLAMLRSGATIDVSVTDGKAQALACKSSLVEGPFTLALRHLSALRFEAASENDGGFAKAIAAPAADVDLLFVKQAEKIMRLSVTCRGAEEGVLLVDALGEARRLPFAQLHGIVFAKNSGAPAPRQPMPRVQIELAGDAPLEGKLQTLDEKSVRVRLDEGIVLAAPLARLARLLVRSDKLAWLSDLKPSKVEQTPAFDRTWPWLVDKAPSGGAIELRDTEHARGLVLIPRTRLTFAIDGAFDSLRAVIGIDDKSGPQANAVFRVLGDDKLLFERKDVTHATEPESIDVRVTGVQRLVLETDFGANFDFGDHCVFASARLVKN